MNRMPLGKYKNQPFDQVPIDYLHWLAGQDWPSETLREATVDEIARRAGNSSSLIEYEPETEDLPATVGPDLARALVQAGQSVLTKQYPAEDYPDLALALEITAEMLTTWALEVFKAEQAS